MSTLIRCPYCGTDHILDGDFSSFKCNCFQQRITDQVICLEAKIDKLIEKVDE